MHLDFPGPWGLYLLPPLLSQLEGALSVGNIRQGDVCSAALRPGGGTVIMKSGPVDSMLS